MADCRVGLGRDGCPRRRVAHARSLGACSQKGATDAVLDVAIAGWLAGLLVQGTGFGLVGDIVVGVLGALIAGFLFPMLGIALALGGGLLGAIILAFIGAVILLVIVKVIKQLTA
jgi:uncharacterized membrane protein YeaQ/YmgE (transglycosylase-associated protein family)